ncbi:BLOC-1-related complex subunit 5 isoform X2 [Daktulosphaira vitifoliae]|uniref:BLOC-1-related complex subunit 5 isoform X2 n=1 Tax=Daktulosphaira vitifoliae TaxID=58002 RepID=UPI0021AA2BB8|nr:BLOC-1-related complex subunit 5 isoform X2 [Daktulosphaira vitifoliae]
MSSQANVSSNQSKSKNMKLKRGKSVPESSWHHNSQDGHYSKAVSTNTSPGHSVCSDKDLAFVSYTINEPIGDSPKKPSTITRGRSMQMETKKATKKLSKVAPKHNIVVVRAAVQEDKDIDEDLSRLKQVPSFLPIIRGTVSLPAARDREALERIDSNSFYRLCFQYQIYLNSCAKAVSSDQTLINKQISELENDTAKILSQHLANYKHYAKVCEQFKCINDMNKRLNACHLLLNQTLDSVQILNNNLPVEDRLEPFVWTTG